MTRTAAALLALAVLVAACGSAGGEELPPTDPNVAVLQVESRGGFVGPDFLFTQLPSFTLLGDGRVLQPGAVPAIFPGPLLMPIQERRLSADGVQRIMREVAAIGLFGSSREFRSPMVADAPDTVFTLRVGERQTVISVNALGIDGPGLSAEEARAHRALSTLNERLMSLDWLPPSAWMEDGWHPYRPSAYRLLIRETDPAEQEPSGIGVNVVPWPAGDPQAGVPAVLDSRCLVVTGDTADAWTAVLGAANQLTRWTSGAKRYQVQPRSLLPNEAADCTPLER